jgi:hypothetical protein
MSLPTDPKERKAIPIYSGFVKYFPRAMAAVAQLSQIANEQHNPGEPLHWAKEKSTDEQDALMRHVVDQAQGELYDGDRVLHATKEAWRGMANLERLLESGVAPLAPPIMAAYPWKTDARPLMPGIDIGKPGGDMSAVSKAWWDGDTLKVESVDIYEPPKPPIIGIDCPCTNCSRARGEKVNCFWCDHPTDHEHGCVYDVRTGSTATEVANAQRTETRAEEYLGTCTNPNCRCHWPPRICTDCGADLEETVHSPICLRRNR